MNTAHLACVFSLSGNPVVLSKIGLGCGVQVFPFGFDLRPTGGQRRRGL